MGCIRETDAELFDVFRTSGTKHHAEATAVGPWFLEGSGFGVADVIG